MNFWTLYEYYMFVHRGVNVHSNMKTEEALTCRAKICTIVCWMCVRGELLTFIEKRDCVYEHKDGHRQIDFDR